MSIAFGLSTGMRQLVTRRHPAAASTWTEPMIRLAQF